MWWSVFERCFQIAQTVAPAPDVEDMRAMQQAAEYTLARGRVSPDYPHHHSNVPCLLPLWVERVRLSISRPPVLPSPLFRRVGIHIITFEACSGFTRVTAGRIAQPPKMAFVTRLRSCQLPDKAARQLQDLSTTIWVEPSSTAATRLRGVLKNQG